MLKKRCCSNAWECVVVGGGKILMMSQYYLILYIKFIKLPPNLCGFNKAVNEEHAHSVDTVYDISTCRQILCHSNVLAFLTAACFFLNKYRDE